MTVKKILIVVSLVALFYVSLCDMPALADNDNGSTKSVDGGVVYISPEEVLFADYWVPAENGFWLTFWDSLRINSGKVMVDGQNYTYYGFDDATDPYRYYYYSSNIYYITRFKLTCYSDLPNNHVQIWGYLITALKKITFDSNGSTSVTTQYLNDGSLVTEPEVPTRTGYTFNGWYGDAALSAPWNFDADTIGASDMTLYAGWTITQNSVTFESNGGSNVAPVTQDYGTKVAEPVEPTREGYAFDRWYKDIGLTNIWNFSTDTVGATNIILYAKWQINQYDVTFRSNGGSTITSQLLDYNSLILEPPAPVRAGYTFAGWFSDEELTTPWDFDSDTIGASDMILYAGWTNNQNGSFSFTNDTYTVHIPSFESNTIAVNASGIDEDGNTIDSNNITYSLDKTYSGVTINSSAGVVTVTSEADAGSVQINAEYGDLSCKAILYLVSVEPGSEFTFSVTADETYDLTLSADNMSGLKNKTFVISYDSSVLNPSDLCAFTYRKELTTGEIIRTSITIESISAGQITFTLDKTISNGNIWTGVLNIFKFKALSSQETTITIKTQMA